MHPLAAKNKYVGMFFMKMSQQYFSLGRDGIRKISVPHAKDLKKYNPDLTHFVCTGLDARYDQVTMVEADTLDRDPQCGGGLSHGSERGLHRHCECGGGDSGTTAWASRGMINN